MKNRFLKNIIIRPKFQLTLLASFMIFTISNIVLFYFSTQYFFSVFRGKGEELGIPPQHIFFRFISELEGEMNLIFSISTFVSLIILTLLGLFLSHKIAGPLYRLSAELKLMKREKKLKKIKFRKGDYCSDIEKEFNEVVDTLA